jgi:predicted phosphodiesterase
MVKPILKGAAVAVAIVALASCGKTDISGMFWNAGASVEERVEQSLEYNRQHGDISLTLPSDNYRFYVCGDIYTEDYPHRFERMMRTQRNDSTVAFGLMLGDLVTTTGTMPVVADVAKYNPATDRYDTPEFFIVGNHDLFFNQWEDFRRLFGSSTYSFVVSTPRFRDLFVMLDSGGGTHGKMQMQWLRDRLSDRSSYRHCVVCTHVNLFRTDLSQVASGGLPREEVYELVDIMNRYNVDIILQGHDHNRNITMLDGVTYLTLDCLKDKSDSASYVVVDASERLNWHFVDVK